MMGIILFFKGSLIDDNDLERRSHETLKSAMEGIHEDNLDFHNMIADMLGEDQGISKESISLDGN